MGNSSGAKWYVDWCEPIVVALYERDQTAIRQRITDAHAALESGALDPESLACLRYQLAYLEFQAQGVLGDSGCREKQLQLAQVLATPSEVDAAERLRIRLYVQARTFLDRLGILGLPPEELEGLINSLPEQEHTTELWHHVSGWSFLHDQAEYLARAYEFAVTQARGFNVEWTWHRVNVMWRLISGNAEKSDLAWLIDKIEMQQQIKSIKKDIWPRAEAMGLIDEELEEKLRDRDYELSVRQRESLASILTARQGDHPGQQTSPAGGAAV
jgi:hypothetical protein